MRLTNKKTLEDGIIIYTSGDKLIDGYMLGGNAVNKLGQLEDILEGHNIETLKELDGLLWYAKQIKTIEEELGIDLVTLFKALKDGLYTIYHGEIDFMFSSDLSYEPTIKGILVHLHYYTIILELADYGKTWALTKEELN